MDAMLRQWAMLRMIPRAPRRIDSGSLQRKLSTSGYEVTLRTVQRDLNNLSVIWPLTSDDSKPQGWWWPTEANLDMPGLDSQTALVFAIAEMHLTKILPSATLEALDPWFKAAHGVLNTTTSKNKKWIDKVRILPQGLSLLPPKIDPMIQSTVYQGLEDGVCIKMTYRTKGVKPYKSYMVNPLALIQKGQLLYIACTVNDYSDIRLLLLHRIASAALTTSPAAKPPIGFNLDRFIQEGHAGFQLGSPVRLVADFAEVAAILLYETPLSLDQTLTQIRAGQVRLEATVADTFDLRAWLRSFGSDVTVVSPKRLLT